MDDVDFYALAATERSVLGVSVGSTLHEVEQVFGLHFLDDRQRNALRRDYGLLEFAFHWDSRWTCRSISIQVHRLAWEADDVIPAVLRNEFGEFSPRVEMETLNRAIAERGFRSIPVQNDGSSDFVRTIVEGSGVELIATRPTLVDGFDQPRPSDVWSILLRSS